MEHSTAFYFCVNNRHSSAEKCIANTYNGEEDLPERASTSLTLPQLNKTHTTFEWNAQINIPDPSVSL